eukprot:CAMPEP_0173113482 /NCGR_PEP_ID=MMETSP1102-20130122/46887_1 /TAXON_ID=49646 /ORGANISM="Geminigera sp., Strain Caron Lab Isolate" /LENGTH=100 /DNA_ID=CAMNT_0014015247 /DNA_START=152 /DNA_END=454 /DNA_ORIENTATION=-
MPLKNDLDPSSLSMRVTQSTTPAYGAKFEAACVMSLVLTTSIGCVIITAIPAAIAPSAAFAPFPGAVPKEDSNKVLRYENPVNDIHTVGVLRATVGRKPV